MIKQFDINPDVRVTLQQYLDSKSLTLKEAMDQESTNNDVAVIIHGGLPTMVKKIYPEGKMKKLFWGKKDLIFDFISGRLQVADAKKVIKKKQKR